MSVALGRRSRSLLENFSLPFDTFCCQNRCIGQLTVSACSLIRSYFASLDTEAAKRQFTWDAIRHGKHFENDIIFRGVWLTHVSVPPLSVFMCCTALHHVSGAGMNQ